MRLEILYANSSHGDGRYLREATQSARSFRRFLPDAHYVLYTDLTNFRDAAFDSVVTVPFVVPQSLAKRLHFNGQMLVKISAMLESRHERVLVLGSDTYALNEHVRDLPRLLETFDIAVAHAPRRINTSMRNSPIPEVPRAFPEFNCDLILFRNTDKVRKVISDWRQRYVNDEFQHPHDQGTFRYVMFFSDLRIATLPPEYNYRGWDVRRDTVILQHREMLPRYLAGEGLARRIVKRLARAVLER